MSLTRRSHTTGPGTTDQQYGYIRWLLFRAGPFQGPQTDPFPWSCVASWFDSSDNRWSWRLHIWLWLFLFLFCRCIAVLLVIVLRDVVAHVLWPRRGINMLAVVAHKCCELEVSAVFGWRQQETCSDNYVKQLITTRWRSMMVECGMLQMQSAHSQVLR